MAMRPTSEELEKYNSYLDNMAEYKITPKPLEVWLANYRTVQARIKKMKKLQDAKSTKAKAKK